MLAISVALERHLLHTSRLETQRLRDSDSLNERRVTVNLLPPFIILCAPMGRPSRWGGEIELR